MVVEVSGSDGRLVSVARLVLVASEAALVVGLTLDSSLDVGAQAVITTAETSRSRTVR